MDVGAIWQIQLNHTANKRTAEISTSKIAIISMRHGYSRQRRTIGSFSAIKISSVAVKLYS